MERTIYDPSALKDEDEWAKGLPDATTPAQTTSTPNRPGFLPDADDEVKALADEDEWAKNLPG